MKLSLAFIIITISSSISYAQVNLEWARRYNGPANDYDGAGGIAVDRYGNVYVTGTSTGLGTGFDYTTVRYNSMGDSLWVRRYHESNYDIGDDVVVDSSGNVYVTGGSVTIKYSGNGNQVWVAQNNGECVRIAIDNSGFIYAAGIGYDNYLTNKFDNNGNLLWRAVYNGPANNTDRIKDMILDPFGNIIVTGYSWGIGGTYYDYCTIKYNSQGDSLWVRRYNGPGPPNSSADYATALAMDNFGDIYVTGQSIGADNNFNILTIKYNLNGDSLWVRRYNIPGTGGRDIEIDKLGNVFVGGLSGSNYIVLKYSNNGILLATASLPGTFGPPDPKIVIDSSNNIFIATSKDVSSTRIDLVITKYDNSLNQLWQFHYNGGLQNNYSFAATDMILNLTGNIYISGISNVLGSGTSYDYLIIKLSQTVGIIKNQNNLIENYKLYQNYPNPFNPVTIINFQLPIFPEGTHSSNYVKVIVYDVLGKEVATLVNEELKPGTYEVEWDGINYPSGVYYYSLKTESFQQTKKMILLK